MRMDARTWFTPKQKAELWGALEERSMCSGHRSSAREEEQERCLSDLSSQRRNCAGATPQSYIDRWTHCL